MELQDQTIVFNISQSQNSAFICLPLLCVPVVIPAPPSRDEIYHVWRAAALLVHEPLTAGGPL